MANVDQTGCSDEFNSNFSSTNSSELASPKSLPKTLEGPNVNSRSESVDEIIMDVPFTTPPGPALAQAGPSVSKGKDLSLLLKPGERYQTP